MKLNYKKYGDSGEVVIILHGIFGMLDNWHSFASQLGKDYIVYTLDHRNHGRSPHDDEFSYEVDKYTNCLFSKTSLERMLKEWRDDDFSMNSLCTEDIFVDNFTCTYFEQIEDGDCSGTIFDVGEFINDSDSDDNEDPGLDLTIDISDTTLERYEPFSGTFSLDFDDSVEQGWMVFLINGPVGGEGSLRVHLNESSVEHDFQSKIKIDGDWFTSSCFDEESR